MIPKSDVRIDKMRGRGPGGQNRNKVNSCVRVTHLPTGTVVTIDGRDQGKNIKEAMRVLEERLAQQAADVKAAAKKAKRDVAIHSTEVIRTYNFSRNEVKDHRTGKVASIKEVLGKGKIELISPA